MNNQKVIRILLILVIIYQAGYLIIQTGFWGYNSLAELLGCYIDHGTTILFCIVLQYLLKASSDE